MARKAARANLFEVAGGATSVTYATTGIAGRPSFHFRDADHDVNAEGTDIRTKKTELGALVTIDLDVVSVAMAKAAPPVDLRTAASRDAKPPRCEATRQECLPLGVAAMATIGLVSAMSPVDPKKPASPKAKTPPSEATSQ